MPAIGAASILSAFAGWAVPAWITRKKDAGQLALDHVKQCMADIDTLKAENKDCQERAEALARRCDRNELALRLTLPELHKATPDSPGLRQAINLLTAYPVDATLPEDWQALLAKLA